MANVFKNAISSSIGTSDVIVYTVPSATTTTVIGISVANVTAQNISVSVQVTDTSAAKSAYIVKNAPVAASGSIVLVGGEQKVVLEATDTIKVTSTAATSADVVVSVLEMT